MSKIILSFVFCATTTFLFSQKKSLSYYELVKNADSLYFSGEYIQAVIKYKMANDVSVSKTETKNLYNASCCWALSNHPDSAFFTLNYIATVLNYNNYNHISSDSDLRSLHEDKRWLPLLNLIKNNKENLEAKLNKPLVKQLDSIYESDQKYRLQDDEIEKKYGSNSKERTALWKIILAKDSINLIKTNTIFNKYGGWPSLDEIGEQGSFALFLVIQHSDIVSQEYYLPIMKQAVKDGKLAGRHLALLEDRVALKQGKKQIYGSQIGNNIKMKFDYVRPLEDPDNVDKRRESVGLEPFSDYLKYWNLKWDVNQYKKDLPIIELKEKELKLLQAK